MELAEKIPQRELRNPKKNKNNEKPQAYAATYNKNNSELFTEIMKNLELKEKKRNTRQQKIIKSQRQPKNLKRILTSSTFGEEPKELPNAIINDAKYGI